MAIVWIPAPLRDLTGGSETVIVSGSNVRQAIESLEVSFPGMRQRLCDGEGLRAGIAVVVDSRIAPLGLLEPVMEQSEIQFLPAIGGG